MATNFRETRHYTGEILPVNAILKFSITMNDKIFDKSTKTSYDIGHCL